MVTREKHEIDEQQSDTMASLEEQNNLVKQRVKDQESQICGLEKEVSQLRTQPSSQIKDPTLESDITAALEEHNGLLRQLVEDQEDGISGLEKEIAQLKKQLSGEIKHLEWIELIKRIFEIRWCSFDQNSCLKSIKVYWRLFYIH